MKKWLSQWTQFMQLRKSDHFFIFISFPQFIYDLFHISLTTGLLYTTPAKDLLSLWDYLVEYQINDNCHLCCPVESLEIVLVQHDSVPLVTEVHQECCDQSVLETVVL